MPLGHEDLSLGMAILAPEKVRVYPYLYKCSQTVACKEAGELSPEDTPSPGPQSPETGTVEKRQGPWPRCPGSEGPCSVGPQWARRGAPSGAREQIM